MTSASWTASGAEALFEARARSVLRSLIALIVLVSMGGFSPALLPEEHAQLQQMAALALWCAAIGVSFFVAPVARLQATADVVAIAIFYAFAVVSAGWSGLTAPTLMKAAAMCITTLGAFQVATRLGLDDVIGAVTFALFLLVGGSILLALFVPSIGVNDTWMHGGQWQGMFASKQALGVIGAHLILLATYRKFTGGSWPAFALVAVVAVAGVVGSGSRGGAALAVAASLALYLCRRSIRLMTILAFGPLVLTAVACLMIGYIYLTGDDAFQIAGASIDFTERTFIWQYALSHFNDAPFLGYGLNGFWTIKPIYDYFEQSHGWVLDNYHNGYLAILMEIGLFGFLLFLISTVLITARVLFAIRHRAMPRSHCIFAIVFMLVIFQINLTETNFLRSTSFMSILLIIVQLVVCSVPVERIARLQGSARC